MASAVARAPSPDVDLSPVLAITVRVFKRSPPCEIGQTSPPPRQCGIQADASEYKAWGPWMTFTMVSGLGLVAIPEISNDQPRYQ